MTTAWIRLGVGIGLAVLVAGCGSGTTHNPGAGSAASVSSTPRNAPPGTHLKLGESALVQYVATTATGGDGPTYRLKIDADPIQQGTLADFKGIQLDTDEKQGTPDYVKVAITNVGPKAFVTKDSDPSVALEGVDDTGQNQDSVTFFGNFPRCNDTDPPAQLAPGQTFRTCLTFLVPHGIHAVAYIGSNAYINSPVTWSAS